MKLEVERLLDIAGTLPTDRRAAFLAKECPDPRIRSEVESLLQYATEAESYFDEAIRSVASSVQSSGHPSPGEAFGAYRIVSLLGRGGMGSVYLAERADGEIQQKVAIKLLRGDCLRPVWRDRFLTERQLLASLQHPSITHVIDAGHTSEGHPFLVMEYVEGLPIDVYAEELDVRSRLKLFLRVCDAVSHAHRRLIIHRDLKPSNILVDLSGNPKLLDFGIARLLDDEGSATQTIDQLLTPNYASPEQRAGAVQTTATDIYSLGVVLYKMLAGVLPRENVLPSDVNFQVPRDVDFIVSKALRTKPEDRYLSVDEFAADIRAALDWRPVQARSGDRWYRMRRFLRHYWVPAVAGMLVVSSLSGGLYIANRQRAIAERRFAEVRQLSNKLFEIDTQVTQLAGGSKTRQFIVDTALDYLRRMSSEVGTDPGLALDLGTAYMRVGRVQGVNISPNLGQTDKAEQAEIKAEALIDSVLAAQPRNRTAILRAAQIAHDRMILAGDKDHDEEALRFARKSRVRLEEYLRAGPLNAKSDRAEAQQVVLALTNVANRHMIADEYDEAIRICGRAAEIARATNWPTQAGASLMIVALAQRAKGNLEAALEAAHESVRILEPPPDEKSTGRVSTFALALTREAQILGEDEAISLGRSREAVERLERAMEISGELARRDLNDFSSQFRMFNSETKLAHIVRHTDPARALQLYDDGLQHLARLPGNGGTPRNEVGTLAASVNPLLRLGRSAEARKRLDTAFARLSELKLYPSPRIEVGSAAGNTLRALAEYEAAIGNVRRGAEVYRELVTGILANSGPAASLADTMELSNIYRASARLHRRAGQVGDAAALEARRLALWQRWDTKLPGNAFVRRQIEAARLR